jgi:hypothetical protein
MTLNTHVRVHQWTDPEELHAWFNDHLLLGYERLMGNTVRANAPVLIEREPGQIMNAPGQGFQAWLWTYFSSPDGPLTDNVYDLVPGDERYDEWDAKHYSAIPTAHVSLSFDTAYGYRGPGGVGCGDLHTMYIEALEAEFFTPRGLTFSWQNEFTGEWHEGLDGLDGLGSGGRAATAWFTGEVIPFFTRVSGSPDQV